MIVGQLRPLTGVGAQQINVGPTKPGSKVLFGLAYCRSHRGQKRRDSKPNNTLLWIETEPGKPCAFTASPPRPSRPAPRPPGSAGHAVDDLARRPGAGVLVIYYFPHPVLVITENPHSDENWQCRMTDVMPPPPTPLVGQDDRVTSDCHFSVQLNHFIPGVLSYSVPVFRKCQSDVTPQDERKIDAPDRHGGLEAGGRAPASPSPAKTRSGPARGAPAPVAVSTVDRLCAAYGVQRPFVLHSPTGHQSQNDASVDGCFPLL
jgi:hypothetical protein